MSKFLDLTGIKRNCSAGAESVIAVELPSEPPSHRPSCRYNHNLPALPGKETRIRQVTSILRQHQAETCRSSSISQEHLA
jgi:hypothetical protein